MTAAERMRKVLNDTGAYRLSGKTPGDWEVEACGAGLDLVEETVEKLLKDLFTAAMAEEELGRWEGLFRPQPSGADPETRREMLGCRLRAYPGPAGTDSGKLLLAAGVRGALVEREDGLEVYLGRLLGVTESQALRELDRLLPAHLPWQMKKEMAWVALDACRRAFSDWDQMELTWRQLDELTYQDLETEGS